MPPMDPRRQQQGTAFALRDPWPWRDFATLARDGEALGYRALFLPEIAGRDVFAALAALAGETDSAPAWERDRADGVPRPRS